jgi:hypothetical protein
MHQRALGSCGSRASSRERHSVGGPCVRSCRPGTYGSRVWRSWGSRRGGHGVSTALHDHPRHRAIASTNRSAACDVASPAAAAPTLIAAAEALSRGTYLSKSLLGARHQAPSCVSLAPQLKREWSLVANFGLSRRELSRDVRYLARARIPEFESSHPSHAVGSPRHKWAVSVGRQKVIIFIRASSPRAKLRAPNQWREYE